jgi:hypothetical protein
MKGDRERSSFFVVPKDGSVVKLWFFSNFEHLEFLSDRSHRSPCGDFESLSHRGTM